MKPTTANEGGARSARPRNEGIARDAQVKGSAVLARLQYLRDVHGHSAVDRVSESLSARSRARLEARVLSHEWVPLELLVEICVATDRLYGKGDLALCRELGRYAAQANLTTLYRIFYAFGSPRFIVGHAVRLWRVHYDSGTLTADFEERPLDHRVTLTLRDFTTPHRAHCLGVLGWAERSLELSGAALRVAEETTCRTRGDDACRFVALYRR